MTRRVRGGLLILLLVTGAAGWWIASASTPRWNVLLITLDTTRADRLGCYGSESGLTPNIDRLAARGAVFERAFTPVPLTLPSHTTMMTGLQPPEHGVRLNGQYRLDQEVPTLAAILTEHGYSTGAFLGAVVLDSKYGLDRGFQVYDDEIAAVSPHADAHHQSRDGRDVVDRALRWLDGNSVEPFLCWVHLFDPHTPYVAHEDRFGERFGDAPYDAEIAYVDLQVGRLIEHLEQRGLSGRTLVVIAGDHGESLGEHGERTHGYTVYNATMHVPLVITPPGNEEGRRVPALVNLADLFPTILDFAGLSPPQPVGARSLRPASEGKGLESLACYGESDQPYAEARWTPLRSLTTERWKYVRTPLAELYDLADDPAETRNLAGENEEQVAALDAELVQVESRMAQRQAQRFALSPEEQRTLQSLGYVGSAQGGTPDGSPLPDIKTMLPHYNRYTDAVERIHAGDPEAGAALLESVVAAEPGYFKAWYNLGAARAQQRRFAEAARAFEKAVESDPNPSALAALAKMRLALDQPEQALQPLERAADLSPESPEIHFLLGDAHRKLGRAEQAAEHYQRALECNPGFRPAADALRELSRGPAPQGR